MFTLYDVIRAVTKEQKPIFAPVAMVVQLHYPMDFKKIPDDKRVQIDAPAILSEDKIDRPGAPGSRLRVIERDNRNETGQLYARCRFLLKIYGYPSGTDTDRANFVWLFCRCTWDSETQSWIVSHARELHHGQVIPEHY